MDLDISTLTPVYEYAQNLLATHSDEDLYSLKNECAMAKASLHNTISIIDDIGKSLSSQSHAKALALAATIREALLEVSKITKMAVEVESLKSSRLDIVQLIHLLRQIPSLVRVLIQEHYINLLLKVRQDIINTYGKCPFDYLSEASIMTQLDNFVNELNSKITTLKVIHTQGCFDMQPHEAVPYEQVKEMIRSVP